MVKQPRKFCENQTICEEDKGRGTYTCMAHLAEARAFQCHYSESDIKVMDRYGDGSYRFEIPIGHLGGVCTDFGILPKVKSDLIKKVVEELKKSR